MKLSYTQHPLIGEKQENEVTAEKAKEMIQVISEGYRSKVLNLVRR